MYDTIFFEQVFRDTLRQRYNSNHINNVDLSSFSWTFCINSKNTNINDNCVYLVISVLSLFGSCIDTKHFQPLLYSPYLVLRILNSHEEIKLWYRKIQINTKGYHSSTCTYSYLCSTGT